MKKAFALFFIAGCLLMYLVSCNKTNTVNPASLRIFNIDPNLPPQDLYLNSTVSAASLTYGNKNSFVSILPGTYNIKFATAGTTNYNSDYNIDFTTGKNYMMFLYNGGTQVQSEAFDESFLTLGIDTAEIRFFNFSPNAPLMDVAVKNLDTSKLDTTYTLYTHRYFNDVYYNRAFTIFQRLPAGTYSFKLRYADTTLAFDSLRLTIANQKTYTILARGYFDSSSTVPPFVIDTLQHQ